MPRGTEVIDKRCSKMSRNHFANLLSHRSVKDSFIRKLTTIELMGVDAN